MIAACSDNKIGVYINIRNPFSIDGQYCKKKKKKPRELSLLLLLLFEIDSTALSGVTER